MDKLTVSPVNRLVQVQLTDTVICPANPNRVGLIISNPNANRVTVSFGVPAVDLTGLILRSGAVPAYFPVGWYPGGLTQEIHAIANTAAQDVGIVEFIRDP